MAALAAVRVPGSSITDYPAVCAALAAELAEAGVDLRFGAAVTGLRRLPDGSTVETGAGPVTADVVINCAGLYSDRVAALDRPATEAGSRAEADADADAAAGCRIVPFRGEYFQLRPDRRHLVKGADLPGARPGLPVPRGAPDRHRARAGARRPERGAGAGPRGLPPAHRPAGATSPSWSGSPASAGWPAATWAPAWPNSPGRCRRRRFAADLARLVPGITAARPRPSPAGVRAQALRADGRLVEDFLIVRRGPNVHVLNAPSPAATCALEIGRQIAALAGR